MKKEFYLYIITTYSLFYCQIFIYSIVNNKNLQKYGQAIIKIRIKPIELKNFLIKLAVTYTFFDGVNMFVQV